MSGGKSGVFGSFRPASRAFIPTEPVPTRAADLRRLIDLALRTITFAILGFSPWWLAVEIFYG